MRNRNHLPEGTISRLLCSKQTKERHASKRHGRIHRTFAAALRVDFFASARRAELLKVTVTVL